MHGLSPEEEIDYWRERARRAEAECERLRTKAPGSTSDGYHTFDELYEHRIALFIALCAEVDRRTPTGHVWRSRLHSDSTMFPGWFIMGIDREAGSQIAYHLPLSRWADTDWLGTEDERAPEFDGHSAADVVERLRRFAR